jgi:osmotically-inducible protein OsmY
VSSPARRRCPAERSISDRHPVTALVSEGFRARVEACNLRWHRPTTEIEGCVEGEVSGRELTAAIVVAALLSAVAEAGQKTDTEILRDVFQNIHQAAIFTIFDNVDAAVTNGVVTITGVVTMPHKRSDIEKRLSGISGVRKVVNEVRVLPVSRSDDELRYKVARAIYRHPSFWSYAAMLNPPIRIVVEHGQVTLRGVVASEMERVLARSLAASLTAGQVRNELVTGQQTIRATASKMD